MFAKKEKKEWKENLHYAALLTRKKCLHERRKKHKAYKLYRKFMNFLRIDDIQFAYKLNWILNGRDFEIKIRKAI